MVGGARCLRYFFQIFAVRKVRVKIVVELQVVCLCMSTSFPLPKNDLSNAKNMVVQGIQGLSYPSMWGL